MATKTFTQLQTQLSQMMGDADSTGTALNSKFSSTEIQNAINFAIELIRERFLQPFVATVTWVQDTYDYAPGSLVYITEAFAEAATDGYGQTVSVGTGLFEYQVPIEMISVKRSSSATLQIHFDKNLVSRHNLNQANLKVRLYGYKYQDALSAGSDVCNINYPPVLLLAKEYLHLSAEGRDAASLMKHMRQLQATMTVMGALPDEDIETPGGIWLDK